jgi:serine/threonine-protein kinase
VNVQIAKTAQDQTQVPDVVGKTLGEAKQLFQQAQLNFTVSGPQDDNAIVTSANPNAGQQVPRGTNIALTTVGSGQGNGNGGFFGGGFGEDD